MKKLINLSFIYFILAMIAGVFYREFTKFMDFTDKTTLAIIHTHLLTLGTFIFLILALFSLNTNLLENKKFDIFLKIYNISLPFMAIIMFIRGIFQVLNKSLSTTLNASISGIAGISHILIFISFIILFSVLKNIDKK